ncbi:MAG: 2'-5' RNA ligase family protein [Anaerolineae bacterium]
MQLSTTLTILAPHEVQAVAVPIMRQYCFDSLLRMAAHITVLFPFVSVERLDAACYLLRELCTEIEPFEITLESYGHFPRVTYMQPQNDAPVRALCQKVFAAFPECPPYWGQHGNEPIPHMTVGEFASEAEQAAAILSSYEPVRFSVTRLHVMYGVDKVALPWLTHAVIPLKGSTL